MKIKRAASIPLITCDPDFSIWSPHDKLYEGKTEHWSKNKSSINAYVKIDDEAYTIMGDSIGSKVLEQKYIDVSATSTEYCFENDRITLKIKFTTPLLLDDPYIASRPITYIDFSVVKKRDCKVQVVFSALSDIVKNDSSSVSGLLGETDSLKYCMMGKTDQRPLSESGDRIKINWGYLYVATADAEVQFDNINERIVTNIDIDDTATVLIGYDDLLSINYMGDALKGLWTKKYTSMSNALQKAYEEKEDLMNRCRVLDEDIIGKAYKSGGEEYAFLCTMSYRHAISAHKVVETNKGEILVLSKENASNGCIGTADVSYPSIPVFMLYSTEYLKGLIRPIMDFANCEVWEFDYAPHDVGRYPYAWGQVYALRKNETEGHKINTPNKNMVYPPVYLYPKGNEVYDEKYQMPVEECGNMIIMTANVCLKENSAEFAKKYMHLLDLWKEYLIKYGLNPGNQLCTDDFAGHLSNNINLSIKAIMGIEAYAQIKKLLGEKETYNKYHKIAKEMAEDCEKRAVEGDHTKLTYDKDETWGLKYNIVWDKIWKTNLFSKSILENEVDYYITKTAEFGVPLDNRADYTKSDWVMWCTAFTDDMKKRSKLISPVANFLENSSSRVAFSDWYNTITGEYIHFIARSVQGGIFMPIVADEME